MNTRIIIATLITAVVNFLLGWLIWGILLMGFYEANTIQYEGLMKEMPNLVLIFISGLLYAFLLAYIFDRWANIRNLGKGFIAGMLVGVLITTCFDLYFLAGFNLFNVKVFIVDVIANTIVSGILGGVTAFVLGYGKKAAEE